MKQKRRAGSSPKTRLGLRDMLYFVIWFGVLSGLAEVAIMRTKGLITGGPIVYLRFHTMWMSPLASVAVLGVAGLATLPLLMRLSRPMAVRIAFVVLATTVFVNTLVIESRTLARIHFGAKVMLAVGLAVALQRVIVRRRAFGFERFVRRTVPGLVLLAAVLAVAVGGRRYLKERRIIAGLPDSRPSAPNVLLIVWDTVRSESMSLYGYERQTTPHLTDLAKEGVVFTNAIATSSWTLPTHASLFTGRFHHETRTGWRNCPLDTTYPTLAEALSDHGYVTAGFVANMWYCTLESGIARGFAHYEDRVASAGELARSSALIRFAAEQAWVRRLLGYYERLDRKPARRVTNDFLEWVDGVPNGRPFFAFLNYLDAHLPYLPPPDFTGRFGPVEQQKTFLMRGYKGKVRLPSNTTGAEIESLRNAYDASIAYLDSDLKRLFGELRRRGLLDRTLVILVSDHGEEFGEHDSFTHGRDLHIQSIRVPLVIRCPGVVPHDVKVHEPVTLRDIPATVTNLLALPDDGLFPGQSLCRFWTGSASQGSESLNPVLSELNHAPWMHGAPAAKGEMKAVVIGDMHYIRNGDGSEEIYNLHDDPAELADLIQTPCGAEAAAQARRILERMM